MLFGQQTFDVLPGESIVLHPNVELCGIGEQSIIKSESSVRTAPVLLAHVAKVTLRDLSFDGNNAADPYGLIELKGDSSDILIQGCHLKNAKYGLWFRPSAGGFCKNIIITECFFEDLTESISLGELSASSGGTIESIQLLDCNINNTNFTRTGQSGIVFHQNVANTILQGNMIVGNEEYGISMLSAGDGVSLIGNTIIKNKKSGIFAHYNTTGAHQVSISGNIIHSNQERGILLWASTSNNGPYLFDVSDNQIYKNEFHGIECRGKFLNLRGNQVYENAVDSSGAYCGIYVDGVSNAQPSMYITIANNMITNNGESSQTNTGLYIADYVERVNLVGNIVSRDGNLDNDEQDQGIKIAANTKHVIFKNNQSIGHSGTAGDISKDVIIEAGADIVGESITVRLGDVLQGTSIEMPVFSAPSHTCVLESFFVSATDMNGSSGVFETLYLLDKDNNGGGNLVVSSAEIKTNLGGFVSLSLGNPGSERYLQKNDVISFKNTPTGGGLGFERAILIFHYLTF